MDRIWTSKMRRNFTEITNDISFSGGSNKSASFTPFSALIAFTLASLRPLLKL